MADYKTPLDILEFPRATLYTPAPGTDKERASIGWSVLNGNPRVTVWTRTDDKDKGPIAAGIGHEALEGILDEAEALFKDSDRIDSIATDTLVSPKKPDGNNSFERILGSTLIMGRGEDGICFITLKSADEERPQIVFTFKGFDWHPMRRKSKPFTEQELSSIHALATIRYLKKCMSAMIKGQTPEERKAIAEQRRQARENRLGGGGGGKPNYPTKPQGNGPKTPMTETGGFDEGFAF